ncbi:MAG: LysM peptidoglycan-binding domain-containing protein [Pseudonocardia sp.]|nr:LysM peptidoglycan-binding domain-containing protein [Pseudonocardia sp.]
MARNRGKHRKPSTAGRNIARTALAGAVAGAPFIIAAPAANAAADSTWDRLAQCESSGNWAINTGNGFSGGLQFTKSTWNAFGGGQFAPVAHQASREQQIVVAEKVLAGQGWGAWPACSKKIGASGGPTARSAPAQQVRLSAPAPAVTPATAGAYTVKAGDTLGKIAAAHGTSWQQLAAKNGLANPNLLSIGQKVAV